MKTIKLSGMFKTQKQMLKEIRALKTSEQKQSYVDALTLREAELLFLGLLEVRF